MAGRHVRDGDDAAPLDTTTAEAAEREHLVDPGPDISPGTSVTVDLEAMPSRPHARPSTPHPDALVEHGRVGDGHEME